MTQGAREVKGPKDQGDSLDPQEMQGKEVPWESWAKLDHKVPLESQEPQVAEECLGQMDLWDPKDNQGTLDSLDLLVQRVSLVTVGGQVFQGSKVLEESQEDEDLQELEDPMERLETMVGTGKLESQVYRVFLVGLGPWEPQGTRA